MMRIFKREKQGVKGWLEARVQRAGEKDFVLIWRKPVRNTIVNNGLAQAALLLGDGAAVAFTLGCIGTGVTAATITDTALETQVDNQTAAFSREQTTVANDTAKWISTHTAPGGGWSITEYGLKNSGGVLYNHVVFTAIPLAENDQLEMTYKSQVKKTT